MAFLFRGSTNIKEEVSVSFSNRVISTGEIDFPIDSVNTTFYSKDEIVIHFKSYTLKITNEDFAFSLIYEDLSRSKKKVFFLSCLGSVLLIGLFYSLFSRSSDIAQLIPDKYFDFAIDSTDLPDSFKDSVCKIDNQLTKNILNQLGVRSKYEIYLLNVGFKNAFAYPKDKIIFTNELIEKLNDDEFFAILGHELGHLHYKHYKPAVFRAVVLDFFGIGFSSKFLTYFGSLSNSKHSRDAERQSDEYSADLMINNGIDLRSNISAMEKVSEDNSEFKYLSFMSTHPLTSQRVQYFKNKRSNATKGNSRNSSYLVEKIMKSCEFSDTNK
jgi:Zn-dependent protease with chaperone function